MADRWDMTLPILRLMAAATDGTITTEDARNALVKKLRISMQEQARRMTGGHNKFQNEVRWTFQELKFAGLVSPLQSGEYLITDAGRTVLKNPPPAIDYRYLIDHTDYSENLRRAKKGLDKVKLSDVLGLSELYSRKKLEKLFDTSGWGFETGVFIPDRYESILLFVTEEKTPDRTQYYDRLRGDVLEWDGQESGRTDERIKRHQQQGIELLLFYRKSKSQYRDYGFRYEGPFEYISHSGSNPTHFILRRAASLEEQVETDPDVSVGEYEFTEGKKTKRWTTRYERNPRLKAAVIECHGFKCMACGFVFEEMYGPYGKGYIVAHHLVPVSKSRQETKVDPRNDMAVLCPNCHAMIHQRHGDVLTLDELKEIISRHHTAH